MLLSASEAYRFAVSPVVGKSWPPKQGWPAEIADVGERWGRVRGTASCVAPAEVAAWWSLIARADSRLIADLRACKPTARGRVANWDLVCAILSLHAAADMACAGVGVAGGLPRGASNETKQFVGRANALLQKNGSLNRQVSPERVRVLPKLHTPQLGMTVRSVSMHLTAEDAPIPGKWIQPRWSPISRWEELRLLLLPWPLLIDDDAFVPTHRPPISMDESTFAFFQFEPRRRLDLRLLRRVLVAAKEISGSIDGVVLPEAAIPEKELPRVERVLREAGVGLFVGGVRSKRRNFARVKTLLSGSGSEVDQDKHHRWCVDAGQISTYGIGFRLDPRLRWWEDIEIRARELHFISIYPWLTICPLICEDLARVEPVSRMVRSVGPNLVVALLQDGPQLTGRWPGRYATVFAEDPGSSVLTLSSYGMVRRSVPPGMTPKPVVGLWKDAVTGVRELSLEPGSAGIVIGIRPHWIKEWSADGRHDDGNAASLALFEARQVSVEGLP